MVDVIPEKRSSSPNIFGPSTSSVAVSATASGLLFLATTAAMVLAFFLPFLPFAGGIILVAVLGTLTFLATIWFIVALVRTYRNTSKGAKLKEENEDSGSGLATEQRKSDMSNSESGDDVSKSGTLSTTSVEKEEKITISIRSNNEITNGKTRNGTSIQGDMHINSGGATESNASTPSTTPTGDMHISSPIHNNTSTQKDKESMSPSQGQIILRKLYSWIQGHTLTMDSKFENFIGKVMQETDLVQAMQLTNVENNRTILHYVMGEINKFSVPTKLLRGLLEELAKYGGEKFVKVLGMQDKFGETPLHYVAKYHAVCDILACFDGILSPSQWRSLMEIENNDGDTFLHVFAQNNYNDSKILEIPQLYGGFSPQEICSIKNSKNQKTILHYKAECLPIFFSVLMRKCDSKDLVAEDKDGNTPLHTVLKGCIAGKIPSFVSLLEALEEISEDSPGILKAEKQEG